MIRQISIVEFELLLQKFESEKTMVNVMFVATARSPEFTWKLIGTVTSVRSTRVVIRDETNRCEMVFQIDES